VFQATANIIVASIESYIVSGSAYNIGIGDIKIS
jgi:hypothetical protein